MKLKFSFLLLLSLHFYCNAQDKESLKDRALKNYTFYAQQKFDSVVNYIHPEIFKTISKKDYIKDLKNTSSEKVTISPVHTPPNFYFGEIRKIGDNYYCIYYYDQTMKAKFHEELSKETSDYLIKYTKKRFSADKVVFNERMNAILLLTRMKGVAIAEKSNGYVWTFEALIKDRAVREELGL